MTPPLDPALLDRARKAWRRCAQDGPGETYICGRGEEVCGLHAAIARALEEYGDVEYRRGCWETAAAGEEAMSRRLREIEEPNEPEEEDITW